LERLKQLKTQWKLCVTAVAVLAIGSGVAWAAQPVIDVTVNSSVLKTHAEQVKLLQTAIDDYNKAVAYYNSVGSAADFVSGYMQNPKRLVTELGQCLRGPARMHTGISLPTVCAAFDYVQSEYFLAPNQPVTVAAAGTVRARRETLATDTATRAVALAAQEMERQDQVGQDVAGLAALAESPNTQMGIQNVTNKLLAAMLAEQVRTNALLASLVESQASQHLSNQPLVFTGFGGGLSSSGSGSGSGGGGFGGGTP
jgi:hypothetical protein